jgi:hypothetical protein
MPRKFLPTSLVGSYPQPDWLIDRKKLASRFPPRVRAKELWSGLLLRSWHAEAPGRLITRAPHIAMAGCQHPYGLAQRMRLDLGAFQGRAQRLRRIRRRCLALAMVAPSVGPPVEI